MASIAAVTGFLADRVVGDPVRWHPVAGFGRLALWLERRTYADRRSAGVLYTAVCVGAATAAGVGLRRLAPRGWAGVAVRAGTTWAVLGGESLAREGVRMADALDAGAAAGDLTAARARLSRLCARDPAGLDAAGLARATVESIAENTSDAVVAPLWWGAVAGVPGLLGYRAVNTADAMVGYRTARYTRFGWATARLDDLANLVPARLTGALTALVAPVVGGSPVSAWRVMRRDGARHPSPNAGWCEAAAAGALGVRLGGVNRYGERVESRPVLGEGGRQPEVADIRRAVRLSRAVGLVAAAGGAVVGGLSTRRRTGPAGRVHLRR